MRPEMPSIRVSRRGKIFIGVVIALIVLLSLVGSAARVYTNWLWFGELGYRGVFSTILWSRIVLFLIFGFVLTVIVGANVYLAYRMRPPFRPISPEQENLERYRVVLEPRKKLLFAGLLLVLFIGAGVAGQQSWQVWQLWLHGVSFGVQDPQFHRDISFFAWDYPAYRALLGFGFNAVIFSLVLSLAVHYVFGAFRIATPGPKLTISARRHVTVLVFFFVVLKACAYWLDRYGLVFSDRGKVTGASYTDVHATLPAKTILFWVAILIAIAVLASLWLKSSLIALTSFVVLLIMSIAINGIYPYTVQQFSVKPNANSKEAPYIARNIAATRTAYDIASVSAGGDVTYKGYDTTSPAPASSLPSDKATVSNVRVLDPNVVSPTFNAYQGLNNYYGFPDKLDVDRYTLGGSTADYVVGVRELDAGKLSGNQTNWINEHTFYTHGYGFVAATANSDVNSASSFAEGSIPPSGPLTIDKPQVYFGEKGVDYSVVGGAGNRENDADNSRTTYTGSGGISLSNFFNRLAFAVKYRQTNFVLNNAVSASGAKLIFDRDPRQRVQKVAPYLKVDGDPYPAVINGRIVWMLDGYTTIANYPYSERQSLSSLTTDSLSNANRTAAQPDAQINYIRNSVKATVDAYDGTVKLYAWDESDPVLKTWMKIFPGKILPKSAMPPDVTAHVRYPQDLFEVQRGLLAQYHVDNPVQFYNVQNKWTVPDDPTAEGVDQPPYYLLAANPNSTSQAEYQLTSPMKVNSRTNMAAYISVNSDATSPDYGKFTVLQLPSGSNIQGPEQIFTNFNSDPTISKDISLLSGQGSSVIHGNLLTLPIGNTFLYVEPLYVQGRSSTTFPSLQRVLVNYNGKIGYGENLAMALLNLTQPVVGQDINSLNQGTTPSTPSTGSSPPTTPTPSTSPSAVPSDVTAILAQLDQAYQDYQSATTAKDYAKQGAALGRILQLIDEYNTARKGSSSSQPGTGTPSVTPSKTPSRAPSPSSTSS
ncbi:UPF0182 family protein [Jatrophihabitans telluris]|uniref:UPF0182 protein M6D93_06975 n=1 Tax=Jatrophihabitans telluris TaxID=2038343 RepID=A0ABY4R2Z4_9ACTN|nr:UPF0182 family protein [Jatrophihabitans telluris]UQX90288.1 UPF0182 family protein [Jatrophihabitans telluris]